MDPWANIFPESTYNRNFRRDRFCPAILRPDPFCGVLLARAPRPVRWAPMLAQEKNRNGSGVPSGLALWMTCFQLVDVFGGPTSRIRVVSVSVSRPTPSFLPRTQLCDRMRTPGGLEGPQKDRQAILGLQFGSYSW